VIRWIVDDRLRCRRDRENRSDICEAAPGPGAAAPEEVTVDTSHLDIPGLGIRSLARETGRLSLVGATALFLIGASASAEPSVRPDSRLIYVSASSGDDANSGLSPASPKKSLAGGVSLLRDGYPDWLFLRRGDTWAEGFKPFDFTGRSANEPIVITAYGPGDASPVVLPNDPYAARPDEPFTATYGVDFPDLGDPGAGPVLIPGPGWSGPTGQPSRVGSPNDEGYDAKAIAQFDLVPFQDFSGQLEVGVVAFHMAGIDRVEFSVEGGAWQSVDEMTRNPRTDVDEFWVRLDSSEFDEDGFVEIRAIAWPTVGEPRVLSQTLFVDTGETREQHTLYVSSDGSDSANGSVDQPYATISRALQTIEGDLSRLDGAEIVIQTPGEYNITQIPRILFNEHWVTVRAAEGLDRESVVISANDPTALIRPRTQRLRLEGLSIDFSELQQFYKEDPFVLWFDDCRWFQTAGWTYTAPMSLAPVRNIGDGGLYVTDSVAEDMTYGFVNTNIVRGSHVEKISGDAYQNSRLVLNCTAHNIDGTVAQHHSDLLQYFGHHENVIVFGVEATRVVETQNFFLDHWNTSFKNCAFVRVAVENIQAGAAPFSQMNASQDHVLMLHISNPGQLFMFRDDFEGARQFVGHNVVFANSVLERVQAADYFAPIPDGVSFRNCHFSSGITQGEAATFGSIAVIPDGQHSFRHEGPGVQEISGSGLPIPGLAESLLQRGAWNITQAESD
jgi:hypothetical protein